MTTPLCSVVIPTFNRSRLLRYTLESLARQSLPSGAFEVLVVDDGSSDDTADVAASFSGRLPLRYLFQEDKGYRVAAARNLGLRHASAPVTVFADSGVLLHSRALQAHLDSHHREQRPAAVCGYVYGFNQNNEDGAEIEQAIDYRNPDTTIAGLAARKRWLDYREEFYEKYSDEFGGLPAPWLVWWTCNVSARTGQLRALGGFDENYRSWGGEDIDLAYRLHRDGARLLLNRAAAGIHAPHPKSYSESLDSVTENYRYFAGKFGTPITALVAPENHFFEINDMILARALPSCAEYLASRDPGEPSALVVAERTEEAVRACGGVLSRKASRGGDVRVAIASSGHGQPTRVPGLGESGLDFLGFSGASPRELREATLKLLAQHRDVDEVYLPHDTRESGTRRIAGRITLECLWELGMAPRVYRYLLSGGPPGVGERLVGRDVTPYLAMKRAALAGYGVGGPGIRDLEEFWTDAGREA